MVVSAGVYIYQHQERTDSILDDKGKEAFDLLAHWSQGNVVVLIRHAERCDRSENECLDGEDGITVSGKAMSIRLGNDFRSLLSLKNATIFNSPVKRTSQTAKFIFGRASIAQSWLRDDCREGFLDDIFEYKEDGKNMVLVTHGTCINYLQDSDGEKLIALDADARETYGITIFLVIDSLAKQAHVLGFLYPDAWTKALSQRRLPGG